MPDDNNLQILLALDDVRLRNLYQRLLERRGYHCVVADSKQAVQSTIGHYRADLLIVDSSLKDLDIIAFIPSLRAQGFHHKIIFLSPYFGDTPNYYLQLIHDLDVDLILQKPVSPMEFGIQVDYLLGIDKNYNFVDELTANREFEVIRQEFINNLDVQLENIDYLLQQLRDDNCPKDSLEQVILHANQLRSAASHYGFFDLGQALSVIEFGLLSLIKEPQSEFSHNHFWIQAEKALEQAYAVCRRIQYNVRIHESSVAEELIAAPTILVIEPDSQFLRTLKQYGEQHLVRVLTSRTLEEALHKVRNPIVDAIIINASHYSSVDVSTICEQLRESSPSTNIPLALLYDDRQSLDRVQGLYTGAALTLHKPLDSEQFINAVKRLLALRQSEQTTVLLIDHDLDFTHQLDSFLRPEGMAVARLRDASKILVELERISPDVVILNAIMPGISGFDICRMLRTIPRWQDIPILFITDRAGDETRIAAFQAGADDYLVKPVIKEELLARINVRIERARLLRERANRDVLTGLLTRRAFVEQLNARMSEVSRHNLPLAFCLLDLDHFKTLNDTYGHLVGDRILTTLGRLLLSRFRIEDLRARWGGEEFAIVLVNENANTAQKVLQRILDEFSNLEFTSDNGQCFHVSFSAGISQYPEDGITPEALLACADQRLFQAKHAGRNRIITHRNTPISRHNSTAGDGLNTK